MGKRGRKRGSFTLTEEQKKSISKSKIGNSNSLGMKHTKAAKKAISDKNSKKVDVYLAETGEYVATFDSQTKASKKLKVNQGLISVCCAGLQKSSKGYIFTHHV